MQELRKSRQRDAILYDLQHRCDHPTAMEIYLSVREKFPKMSLGTLYRNLSLLEETGQIVSLTLGGEEHFDAKTTLHYHFKCNKCGRYYDMPIPLFPEIKDACLKIPEGQIDGYSLIFYGTCEDCLHKIV